MEPKTLDELLQHLPAMRKLRSINADLLRVLLGRKKRECTWCGSVVPKGCQTWCSGECVTAFKLRCQPVSASVFVYERDKGICRICGIDVSKIPYEVDHIIPVCEGGGLMPPENLRLLCRSCHAAETAKLSGRRFTSRSGYPSWIKCECRTEGCDGFQLFVKRSTKGRYRLECDICRSAWVVGQQFMDSVLCKENINGR